MRFIKRLLGLEHKDGEPIPVCDNRFEKEVLNNSLPCFVDFYSLWCSPCQVMSGLLNEVGPQYIGRAAFFKVDINKSPSTAGLFKINSVPTLIVVKNGREIDRFAGLMPLNSLRAWIEEHIQD